jgi:signal transduction histidine kinase
MDSISLSEKSLRLRYEAFSKFASEVNKANEWGKIGQTVASNLKFMVDFFAFRLSFTHYQDRLTFFVFRGNYEFHLHYIDALTPYEMKWESDGLPLKFDKDEIAENNYFSGSIFGHQKVNQIFILPFLFSAEESAVMTVANKNLVVYSEADFRFFRLISELLTTKISQLFLQTTIVQKNQTLAEANEKIMQINTNLESTVKERTYKLQEANKELNTLFYRTSHDFRRPLTSMLGLVKIAELSVKEQTALDLFKQYEHTIHELDKMLAKLQSISVEEDNFVIEPIHFDEIVAVLKEKYDTLILQKSIHFQTHYAINKSFYGEKAAISAILENLIENAIYFCTYKEPFIKVKITDSDKYLVIIVEDNGEGIVDTLKNKIFEMYFRGTESSKGNGLGLYVVKKLVQKIKGKIYVESKLGEGSNFTVLLPLT